MSILRRISPASAFKVGLVTYGILGLILGTFCSVVAATGLAVARHGHIPIMGRVGVFAIVLCPILYGIIGGIGAAVGASIYNLVAGWVGGLEVDIG